MSEKVSKIFFSHIAIIFNPKSTGNAKHKAEELSTKLSKVYNTTHISLHPTEYAGHAQDIAKEIANVHEQPLLVSVSGDGGYHEVISGIMKLDSSTKRNKLTVAVEAAGNANDHYRHARSNDSLFDAIIQAEIKPLELIEVTRRHGLLQSRYFAHSYWGLGLTPKAVDQLNKEDLTPVREKMIIAKELMNFVPIRVKVNGQEMKVGNIIAAKVGRMSKVVKLHRQESAPPQGKLRLLIDSKPTRSSILGKIIKGVTRGLEKESQLISRFTCEVCEDTKMQLDGEVYPLKKGDVIMVSVSKKVLQTL